MADWLIDRPADPRLFPTVRHRHANGTLDAVRDRTPAAVPELGRAPIERWTYACPCGETWTLERRRFT